VEEKLKSLNPMALKVDNLLKDFRSLATSLSSQISEVRSAVDINAKRIENTSRELESSIARMERIEKEQNRYNVILYNFSPIVRGRYLKEDLITYLPGWCPI
jgi:DNA repair ATPase RecN